MKRGTPLNKQEFDAYLKEAIEDKLLERLGRIVEHLRHTCGWNYREIFDHANTLVTIDVVTWDELMSELDDLDGRR